MERSSTHICWEQQPDGGTFKVDLKSCAIYLPIISGIVTLDCRSLLLRVK